MSDNDTHDDDNDTMLDEMAAELVEKLGVTPEAGRQLVERAELLSLLATEIGGASSEDAAAAATRSILDTVRNARRGYRFALQIFGPDGPPDLPKSDDGAEEVREDAAV